MGWRGSVLLVLITIVGILAGSGTAAAAARDTDQIVLPGASSAEGIAKGPAQTFYAGSSISCREGGSTCDVVVGA